MYNGVNDENNESSFNSDENLYHYSYSKDQAPQPGQPDPSQTSWQPAPRPEPQAAQEDQTSCPTGDYQDEPRIPKTNGKSFWKKTGAASAARPWPARPAKPPSRKPAAPLPPSASNPWTARR